MTKNEIACYLFCVITTTFTLTSSWYYGIPLIVPVISIAIYLIACSPTFTFGIEYQKLQAALDKDLAPKERSKVSRNIKKVSRMKLGRRL
jgi:hypothetical protein